MTDQTAYVVMRDRTPTAVATTLESAQAAAIAAHSEHLTSTTREYRWDPTEWPEGALVLKTRTGSTGRFVKADWSVVPVPHIS